MVLTGGSLSVQLVRRLIGHSKNGRWAQSGVGSLQVRLCEFDRFSHNKCVWLRISATPQAGLPCQIHESRRRQHKRGGFGNPIKRLLIAVC
jgi:hypothetical protein